MDLLYSHFILWFKVECASGHVAVVMCIYTAQQHKNLRKCLPCCTFRVFPVTLPVGWLPLLPLAACEYDVVLVYLAGWLLELICGWEEGVRRKGIQCAPLGSLEWQGLVLLPMLFPWEPFGHKKIWLQKETQIRVCGVWHGLESLGQPNVHLVSVFPCFIWGVQQDTLPACGVICIHRLSLTLPRHTEKAYRVHRPV